MDDFKAWYGLFFTNGGRNWRDWYQRVVIKPKRGLGSAVFDFDFICMFFAVTAWISQLYRKQAVNETLYSEELFIRHLTTLTLIPPFALSTLYCILMPTVEKLVGCTRRHASRKTRALRYLRPRAQDSPAPDEVESSSDESGSSGDLESAAAPGQGPGESGRPIAEDAPAHGPTPDSCERGVPLALSAVIVVSLEIFESLIPVALCIHLVDHKLLITGIIVKYKFWQIVLFLLESAISMQNCCERVDRVVPCLREVAELLVHANHMARDIFVSFFIGLSLSPWVFMTALNDFCCPTWSIHQALIYRQKVSLAKKRDFDDSDEDTELGSDSSVSEVSSVEGAPPMTSGPPVPTGTMEPPPGGSVTVLQAPAAGAGARAIFVGTR